MQKQEKSLPKDQKVIGDKYRIIKKLKSGGFGSVYIARGLENDQKYAIKLMPKKYESYARLQNYLYQQIKQKKFTLGFIKYYDYGVIEQQLYLVMELIGYDLEEIMKRMKNKKFSLKTVLMIGLQVIDRIQALHGIGYIHRDIKPDNLAIGNKENNNMVYLFDFGLVFKSNAEIPAQEKGKVIGSLAYMSLRSHQGKKALFLDDIQSYAYTLIYLATGSLPWMNIEIRTLADYHRVKIMKEKLNRQWFKKNQVPEEIYQILEMSRKNNEKQKIDYLNIKYKILSALSSIKQKNDFNFDWCGIMRVTHDREDSPVKRAQERKQINAMNKSNQQIVQNQIFQVYKFMNQQEKANNKNKTPQRKNIKRKSPETKTKKQNNQKERVESLRKIETVNKNFKQKEKRPQSSRNAQKQKIARQLEKKMKQLDKIGHQGPRIAINHSRNYAL